MSTNHRTPWLLAAYYWSPYLAFVVLEGSRLIEVTTHRRQSADSAHHQMQALIAAMVRNYAPDRIVLEPGSYLYQAATSTALAIQTITMTTVKQLVTGTDEPVLHEDLYRHLVEHRPELQRLATIVDSGGTTADTDQRRAAQLLAIALGFAAHDLAPGEQQELSTSPQLSFMS